MARDRPDPVSKKVGTRLRGPDRAGAAVHTHTVIDVALLSLAEKLPISAPHCIRVLLDPPPMSIHLLV